MKPLSKNSPLIIPMMIALCALTAPPAIGGLAGETAIWQPMVAWEKTGSETGNEQRFPRGYDPLLLSLGRSVYADLQEARQAALNKRITNLRVSLQEARETLHRLRLPGQVVALQNQLRVIRNDLQDRSKSLDDELWVPVEVEIDEVLVYAPEKIRTKTSAAIKKGRSAAHKGDSETAMAQLDVVTSSLQYSLGIFPLHKVKQDLETAWLTASLPKPDWTGTLEAVQSALATFHWYTRVPIHGLLAAYDNVISAYVLASNPAFRPDQEHQVLEYLTKAQNNLSRAPGGEPLVKKVRGLIDRIKPQGSEIKGLLDDIQLQIHLQRQQAEDQYRDAISHQVVQ